MDWSRLILLLLLLIPISSTIIAQEDSLIFTVSFYFEDAAGNKDTVLWSGVNAGNPLEDGTEFGVDLSDTPFDSVFEARAYEIRQFSDTRDEVVPTYDHFIAFWELRSDDTYCDELGFPGEAPGFAIKAIHPPVTIRWNQSLFDPDEGIFRCWEGTALVDNHSPETLDFWWLGEVPGVYEPQISCMSLDTVMIIEDTPNTYYNYASLWGMGTFKLATDPNYIDSTYVALFWPNPFYTPYCFPVSTENPRRVVAELPIFPNPATAAFRVDVSRFSSDELADAELLLHDGSGRVLLRKIGVSANTITDVSTLPPGIFFVSLRTRSGRYLTKLVKH